MTLKVSQRVMRWDYRTGKLMEERFFFFLITGDDLSAHARVHAKSSSIASPLKAQQRRRLAGLKMNTNLSDTGVKMGKTSGSLPKCAFSWLLSRLPVNSARASKRAQDAKIKGDKQLKMINYLPLFTVACWGKLDRRLI